MKSASLRLVPMAAVIAFAGCIITTSNPPPPRNAYESCTSADVCAGSTSCVTANFVAPGSTSGGAFCSAPCTTSSSCPADSSGVGVSCVTSNGTSQCYRACGGGNTCPTNETCLQIASSGPPVSVCVPVGPAGPQCAATGASCASTPCCSGLQCVSGTCQACGNTGQSCCAGGACASGLACGTTNLCQLCGAMGQMCCAGSPACNTGLNCVGGTCSACGGAGQACCPGNVCGAGLACGTDGNCNLAPYSACAGSSVGHPCLGGMNSAGQVITTACTIPEIANPGPSGFCTHRCSGMAGSMLECPQWPSAPRSYTYNCYQLQGAADPMCFVDCTGGQACPTGTTCNMVNTAGGAPIQICIPPPM